MGSHVWDSKSITGLDPFTWNSQIKHHDLYQAAGWVGITQTTEHPNVRIGNYSIVINKFEWIMICQNDNK